MENVIRTAIKGGYERFNPGRAEMPVEKIFLDPVFWQSLGKELGWEKWYKPYKDEQTEWQSNWHHFIDSLAEGRSPEDFFTSLLEGKS